MAQEEILGVDFAEVYKNSDLYRYKIKHVLGMHELHDHGTHRILVHGVYHCRRNKALISELSAPPPGSKDLFFPTKYSQSFLTQCMACLWKQHKSYWRNPSYTATRIFFTTVIALIFGTIFWKLGKKV